MATVFDANRDTGDDVYFGTVGSDTLRPNFVGENDSDEYDTFVVRAGDDTVVLDTTRDDDVDFFGAGGDDIFSGAVGADLAVGAAGDDRFNTFAGDDALVGEAGYDGLRAGRGRDYIEGGAQGDRLIGGNDDDRDAFVFGRLESRSTNGEADTVVDYKDDDVLVFVGGSGSIDVEVREANNIVTIEQAENFVENNFVLRQQDYVVLYNETTDKAFLVADLVNSPGTDFETGVIFNSAGNRGDALDIADGIREVGTLDEARITYGNNFFDLA